MPETAAPADVYIASTGVYLPPLQPMRELIDAGLYTDELLEETQLESVAVSIDVFPADMAVAAAKQALAAWGHPPSDMAITLHAHLAAQGLVAWHAPSYVHRFAVGNSCPAIGIEQMSNGGLAALSLAATHLRATKDARAVLITTADRFEGIPHGRCLFDDVLILGDGATACVVTRDEGFARVCSSRTFADSSLEALHRGDAPFVDEADLYADPSSYGQRKREHFARHPPAEAIEKFAIGGGTAIAQALADAGIAKEQVDHWILPNMGLHELESYYLRPLGVELEQTCWSFGRTVGHLGAGDQIAGMHQLRAAGALRVGQHCALVGIGSGFSWSCAIVEIVGP